MTRAGKRGALFGMALPAGIMLWVLWGRWLALAIGLGVLAIGLGVVVSRPVGALEPKP